MKSSKTNSRWQFLLCALGLLLAACSTGCQVSVGGQVLPSPYYQSDDVQYYPSGTEFLLPREAAAQKQYKADQELLGR